MRVGIKCLTSGVPYALHDLGKLDRANIGRIIEDETNPSR
jgi:hypothetical protein